MINKWEGIHLSSFMLLSGIDAWSTGLSADAEETKFFSDSGEES